MAIAAGEDEVQRRSKVVTLICLTGSGKSTTANSKCGEVKFSFSRDNMRQYSAFFDALTRWFKKLGEDPFMIYDTPGFGDAEPKYIPEIVVRGLKNGGYDHEFLIVVNSADPQLSG